MKAALKQLLALAIPCWLLLPIAQATQRSPGSFVPIGGGYTQASLKGFARVVVNAAPGRDIKILVVPTAYGDNPNERQANLQLARNRTALIQSACGAVLQAPAMRCTAQLVPLLDRADALNRDNSALFSAPDVAGVFFLGGDQDVAMRVMAGSPVESAMQAAHERGVAFGGTSAGDSVESRNMVAGYSPGFDDTSELDQGAVSVWWADGGDGQRGLAFGLPGVLLDQHFYQRGRFGRLINMVAQSAAHYHDHGLLGMGFDFGTGAEVRAGGLLTGIFGSSSVAIVDFRTANARYHWGGRGKNLLSARRILTQILGPDPGLAYSVPTRRPEMDGGPVPFRPPENPPACAPAIQNSGKVVLLGGSFDENHDQQLRRFVAVLNVHHVRQVAILVFGKANARRSQAALRRTEADLRASGWNQAIQSWPIDEVGGALQPSEASIVSSGVLMLAGDGATMHSIILQPELRALIGEVMRRSPAVITDGAMTAVLGSAYAGNPWPAPTQVSEAAIQAFRSGAVSIDSGLGLFPTLDFVPRLYANEAWGQLYSLSRADHEVQVVGIGEASALVVQPFMASSANRCATITVTGKQPAVSLDARAATFRPATNGTFSALNVLMNVYAPGDTLTR